MRKSLLYLLTVLLSGSIGASAATLHRLPRTDTFLPLSESGVRAPMLKKARAAALPGATTVLTENFDKCTAGSEASPASEGIAGEIPASWTSTPGWVGATVHQAGGCLFVDSWQTTSNGQPVTTYLLDTPKVGGGAFGALRITFRARTASGSMPLYVINANGNTSTSISTASAEIGPAWGEYEVWFTDAIPASFFEFQADKGAFYIDDITVETVPELTAPKVLPATDITATAYTANWSAVEGAEGYLVYPRISHISDGMEPYYVLDTDFERITEGTVDEPVEPVYVMESLDEIINEQGWLVRLPVRAKSALGLTNKYMGSYGNSLLQSPTLNLSGAKGTVDVRLRWLAQDVDMFQVNLYEVRVDGSVSLRSTKMVYTQEEYNEWKESEFTIGGGTNSCMLVVLLPETTKGTVFFDKMEFSQTLEEGTRFTVPGTTLNVTENSVRVQTPDASADDSRSYSVKAYRVCGGKSVVSPESNSITVGADSDEIPESLATPQPGEAQVQGSRFTASWPAVEGANAYEVQLYRRHTANGNESVTIVNENFDKIDVGTDDLDHPRCMHEDGYDRLDDFTNVPGWEVFQGFYVDGIVGILGYWNMLGVGCYMKSPVFDLSGNGGNMTMSIRIGSDYYNQGATVYLAHDNPETGGVVYDEEFPLDEMERGMHPFTKTFSKGRADSYFVFFPYGYGVSYFDDILVTQKVPAGVHDTRISRRIVSTPSVTMTVPDVNTKDEYFFTVRAIWLDNTDKERVGSDASGEIMLEGLTPATYYSGKVTDPEGKWIPGATVTVRSKDGKSVETATTNRWGLFRVDNICDATARYNAVVTADGFHPALAENLSFAGLKAVEGAELMMRPVADDSRQIGQVTGSSDVGALYLQYNNSDVEAIYTADVLGIPEKSKILGISFDGYCETEKEVTPTVTLKIENTGATGYAAAAPAMGADAFTFWTGEMTLDKTGSATSPDCLLSFANQDGFEYTGQSLRILLQSRCNRNSDFYFLTDATRPGTSVYRYWGRTESEEWEAAPGGLPVMRIIYEAPVDGIQSVTVGSAAQPFDLSTVPGGVRITARDLCRLGIYTVTGIRVADVALSAGQQRTLRLPAGIYIIGNRKVAIR